MTVPEDSVIVSNDVVIKCNIPSFVADFVSVTAWVTSEGTQLKPGHVNGKMGVFGEKYKFIHILLILVSNAMILFLIVTILYKNSGAWLNFLNYPSISFHS